MQLIFDASGNLYGATLGGGNVNRAGSVFKLSPASGGTWTETVLYAFGASPDGNYPYAGVMLGSDGNLYGTTAMGGANNYGTVFQITP